MQLQNISLAYHSIFKVEVERHALSFHQNAKGVLCLVHVHFNKQIYTPDIVSESGTTVANSVNKDAAS